jgi:Ribonuclease G/E
LENGNLVEFLTILKPEIPEIGSVHIARIYQVFRQHKLATAILEDGTPISVRLSSEKLHTGALALVTITSEPWELKPARAILGAQLAGRYVILLPGQNEIARLGRNTITAQPSELALTNEIKKVLPEGFGIILRRQAIGAEQFLIKNEIEILISDWQENGELPADLSVFASPKKLYNGLPLVKLAGIIAPTASIRIGRDDFEWQAVYDQLEKTCESKFTTEQGVVIWFQSTKGLTAIDIDSAGSKMGASELSAHIAEVVMKQIRLRYISGAVFIDMPRLAKTDRKKFHRFCQDFALADIRHPDIYGYGPAGLVEMTIRHTYMPLIDRMNAMSSAI